MTGIKDIDETKMEKGGNFDLIEKKNPNKFQDFLNLKG
jgi:hypothetical protein